MTWFGGALVVLALILFAFITWIETLVPGNASNAGFVWAHCGPFALLGFCLLTGKGNMTRTAWLVFIGLVLLSLAAGLPAVWHSARLAPTSLFIVALIVLPAMILAMRAFAATDPARPADIGKSEER